MHANLNKEGIRMWKRLLATAALAASASGGTFSAQAPDKVDFVRDVQPSVVVMGAGPFGTRSFSSTAEAVNVAIQVPCSVLVAR